MKKTIINVLVKAVALTAFSALIAIVTNALRSDGIPLITEIPYEIFAECVDSIERPELVSTKELSADNTLYVDARPAEAFAVEHAKGAINTTYDVLGGASADEVARVKALIVSKKPTSVVVYGIYEGADLGKSLAQQLIEEGIKNAKHIKGGLEELKKNNVETVKGNGGSK